MPPEKHQAFYYNTLLRSSRNRGQFQCCQFQLGIGSIGNTFTLATFLPLRRPEAEEAGGGGRGWDGVGAVRVEGERGGERDSFLLR